MDISKNVIINIPSFNCDICLKIISGNENLRDCLTCSSQFCSGCFRSYVKERIFNGAIAIGYPGFDCDLIVPINEIKRLVDQDLLNRLNEQIIRHNNFNLQYSDNEDQIRSTIVEHNSDIKPCPRCKTLIQKYKGCSEIMCRFCKIRFNFNTETRIYRPLVPNSQRHRIALVV